ncbi:conserved hypothetical protein, membrane [Candidatus Magnetomorum sp. HK-1]|nr:conserved hypothetical protein, membrane [Candidatus Magnetomorum sp. HK-1]
MAHLQSKNKFMLTYCLILICYPTLSFAQSLNVQSSVVNPVLNIVSWIFFIIAAIGGAIIGSMAAWEIPTYLANKGNHRQPILITIISYAIGIVCFAAMTVGGPTWLVKALTTVSAPTF